jgi:hypothetical protein
MCIYTSSSSVNKSIFIISHQLAVVLISTHEPLRYNPDPTPPRGYNGARDVYQYAVASISYPASYYSRVHGKRLVKHPG